jgi:hypothetical protein
MVSFVGCDLVEVFAASFPVRKRRAANGLDENLRLAAKDFAGDLSLVERLFDGALLVA